MSHTAPLENKPYKQMSAETKEVFPFVWYRKIRKLPVLKVRNY